MNKKALLAMLDAVHELLEAGKLDRLPQDQAHLLPCLYETLDNALKWHAAHGPGPLTWCGGCKNLRGAKHECQM